MAGFTRTFMAAVLALLALADAAAADFALSGPHHVGTTQISVSRADGSQFASWLLYPARVEGVDTAPEPAGGPYPGLVFGHGFLAPPVIYLASMRHLASWGFVVLAPGSALELFPDHEAYAADFSTALDWLERIDQELGADWAAMIDTGAFGASGHSMGGGAALLAAAADPRLRALGLLAPANTFPISSVQQAVNVRSPTLVVAGSADAITPLWLHALPAFQALPASRQLAVILGGSHCGMVSLPLPGALCGPSAIGLDQQLDAAHRSLLPFLLFHLARRADLENAVWGPQRVWQPPVLIFIDRD